MHGEKGTGFGEHSIQPPSPSANPNTVFVGGIDLFRSDDGGVNWGLTSHWWADKSAPQYVHADHHALAFHPPLQRREQCA